MGGVIEKKNLQAESMKNIHKRVKGRGFYKVCGDTDTNGEWQTGTTAP